MLAGYKEIMAQEQLFWGNSIAGNTIIFSGSEDQGLGSWNQGPGDPGTRDLDWHTASCHWTPKIVVPSLIALLVGETMLHVNYNH